MAKPKYDSIFHVLSAQIESGQYRFQQRLPSENTLAEEFGCTRNTVRKALALLAARGYIQTMQGRGVQVIYRRRRTSTFLFGTIESLREAAARNGLSARTRLLSLEQGTVDDELAEASGLEAGAAITMVHRLRLLDDVPLIVDTSCFLTSVVPDLTAEIVESSIYLHLEEDLGVGVASATRAITVERANEEDRSLLHLEGMDCVVVVRSSTFDSAGSIFEFTCSRHSPVGFEFQATAQRLRPRR